MFTSKRLNCVFVWKLNYVMSHNISRISWRGTNSNLLHYNYNAFVSISHKKACRFLKRIKTKCDDMATKNVLFPTWLFFLIFFTRKTSQNLISVILFCLYFMFYYIDLWGNKWNRKWALTDSDDFPILFIKRDRNCFC